MNMFEIIVLLLHVLMFKIILKCNIKSLSETQSCQIWRKSEDYHIKESRKDQTE